MRTFKLFLLTIFASSFFLGGCAAIGLKSGFKYSGQTYSYTVRNANTSPYGWYEQRLEIHAGLVAQAEVNSYSHRRR